MKKNNKNTTIQEILDIRMQFAYDRGWDKNYKPRNLLLAVANELGELSEYLAWKDEDWLPETEEQRKEIMFEAVDVFNYLLAFVHIFEKEDKDFTEYFYEKMLGLAKKYKVDATREEHHKSKEEYRRSGKNRLYEDSDE